MTGLVEILEAMADRITDTVAGVTHLGQPLPVQVVAGWVFNPTAPVIDMYPGTTSRESESAGFIDLDGGYILTVRTRVSATDHGGMQALLLRFMDDTDDLSLAAALDSEPTLDGAATSLICRNPTGYVQYVGPAGEPWLLGFEFECVVIPVGVS